MSALIVAGNEIIPDTFTVTVDGTEITAKDFQKVLLNINQASATASVADGTDLMQKMEIINKNANACDVSFKGEGGATVKNLKQNQSMRLSWTGSYWYVTFGGLISGVANDGTPFNYTTEVTLDEAPVNTVYSTTEQETGMTWIDGKKIYRKTFVGENVSKLAGTAATVNWSISDLNLDVLVNVVGSSLRQYNGVYYYAYPFWSGFANNDTFSVQTAYATSIDYSSQELSLFISGTLALELPKVYVTIYYTKTTD